MFWMASLTRWTWVWVSFWSWWWIGKLDVLQSVGSQRVLHNWATELNWGDSVDKEFCLQCRRWRQMWIWSLGLEDLLEEGMATYSRIPAWRIPWTEQPRGLQSTGLQRVRHSWSDWARMHVGCTELTCRMLSCCPQRTGELLGMEKLPIYCQKWGMGKNRAQYLCSAASFKKCNIQIWLLIMLKTRTVFLKIQQSTHIVDSVVMQNNSHKRESGRNSENCRSLSSKYCSLEWKKAILIIRLYSPLSLENS